LSADVDVADTDVAVVITVTPARPGARVDANGWPEDISIVWQVQCLTSAAGRKEYLKSGFRSRDLPPGHEH
jgi:hypothetical protein